MTLPERIVKRAEEKGLLASHDKWAEGRYWTFTPLNKVKKLQTGRFRYAILPGTQIVTDVREDRALWWVEAYQEK